MFYLYTYTKECEQVWGKVLKNKKKTGVSRDAKKGLKQAVMSKAMYFYTPTPLL